MTLQNSSGINMALRGIDVNSLWYSAQHPGTNGFCLRIGYPKIHCAKSACAPVKCVFWGIPWYTMVYPMSIHFQTHHDTPFPNKSRTWGKSKHLCHTASEEPICPSVGRRALGANDRVVMVPLVPRRVKSSVSSPFTAPFGHVEVCRVERKGVAMSFHISPCNKHGDIP